MSQAERIRFRSSLRESATVGMSLARWALFKMSSRAFMREVSLSQLKREATAQLGRGKT